MYNLLLEIINKLKECFNKQYKKKERIKYFAVEETVRICYKCDVPKKYNSVKEFADKEGLPAVFENSIYEELLDYLDTYEETIEEC